MSLNPKYAGYIAMSLDGFIATSDGGVGWLDPYNQALATDGGDGGYGEFISDVDGLIVGRKTYEQVLGWGWPYGTRKAYVLTKRPGFTGDHVAAAGDIETLRATINKANLRKIWIMGGGETQRIALDAGMFDSLCIFVMPVILGNGLPCFAPGVKRGLHLSSVEKLPGGIARLDYETGVAQ